jgi:CBS domain-containing protein
MGEEWAMKARDVMTKLIVSVTPETNVTEAVRLMLSNHLSGLLVMNNDQRLVGVVTEGDFLRRVETGTERKRAPWLEFLTGPKKLAEDYVRSHGRTVGEVMSRNVITITEDTTIEDAVATMEKKKIKRLPVLDGTTVVGVLRRTDLMRAMATLGRAEHAPEGGDAAIRNEILNELKQHAWAPIAQIDVAVNDGVVEFWGTITEESQREALRVCAENMAGVKNVIDHLTWVEPISGTVIDAPTSTMPPP